MFGYVLKHEIFLPIIEVNQTIPEFPSIVSLSKYIILFYIFIQTIFIDY